MKVKYYFVRHGGYTETKQFNWLHYHEARNLDTFLSWKESTDLFPAYLTPEQADKLMERWNQLGNGVYVYWWRSENSPER